MNHTLLVLSRAPSLCLGGVRISRQRLECGAFRRFGCRFVAPIGSNSEV